jgi:glycosyltransferase involved in cell wall biosynthesis
LDRSLHAGFPTDGGRMVAKDPRISVVIPVYNEGPCLVKLYDELAATCDPLPYEFEFLFVNDGSADETEEVLAELRRADCRVRYLVMSRNFGHQGALSAGLNFASGDAVIMMDGDLQHPPSLIPRLVACWEAGNDVVNTVRLDTENSPFLKKAMSRAFYAIFKLLTGSSLEAGSADFRLMSRATVDVLNSLNERHRFIRGLVPWIGFRQARVTFRAPARWAGQPKYTFRRSLRLALEGVTAFNLYPLRLATVLGLIVIATSSLVGACTIVKPLFGGQPGSGWISLMSCVAFFGGCQLASIGILGEYLGRTLDQVRGRPLYIVRSACGIDSVGQRDGVTVTAPHFSRSHARRRGPMLQPVHDEVNSGAS